MVFAVHMGLEYPKTDHQSSSEGDTLHHQAGVENHKEMGTRDKDTSHKVEDDLVQVFLLAVGFGTVHDTE
jgi:hypothetical protein